MLTRHLRASSLLTVMLSPDSRFPSGPRMQRPAGQCLREPLASYREQTAYGRGRKEVETRKTQGAAAKWVSQGPRPVFISHSHGWGSQAWPNPRSISQAIETTLSETPLRGRKGYFLLMASVPCFQAVAWQKHWLKDVTLQWPEEAEGEG